jgi:DNA polymerase III subunit delta'
MSISELIGNESIKEWLRRAGAAARLPGALIFAGPEGVGKRTFAVEFAKALNCPDTDGQLDCCNKCPVCRRIEAGQFADVRVIAPDGQFIKVDQVREIVDEIHYQPFEGKRRIYIFESAERLREQAANALLKTLEEPPPQAMLILVTASPDALLPTIRSRTILLRFAPLAEEKLAAHLKMHHPRPAPELRLLVRLAQGSIGRALSIDLSEYLEQRKEGLELIDLMLRRRQRVRLLKAAEYFGRKERPEFESRLAILRLLLRDILCVRLASQQEVINDDTLTRLAELADSTTPALLTTIIERLSALERDMVRNINRQAALEALFLELGDLSAA